MCPPFQVLVMSEESRLGREAIETAYAPKQFVTAGVRVFVYLEDRERTFDSPTDKLLMSLRRSPTNSSARRHAADEALLSRTPTASRHNAELFGIAASVPTVPLFDPEAWLR